MGGGNGVPEALREEIRGLEAFARRLDPGPEERDDLWRAVGAHVLGDLTELEQGPAYAAEAPFDPALLEIAETPAPISAALETIEAVEQPGIHQASGRHFAYIPGGGLFPAALGDLLADVGNCYAGVHFAAPAASLMERSLVRWMAGLVGYPASAGGDLTSGASIANLEGIVTARDAMGISAAVTEHGRRIMDGIERSRTVTMDPHKGLFLPFGSGALVVRDEGQLAEAHRYSAGYLRDAREAGGTFSASDLSVELSRPFRGPRLWLPLKLFGLEPFRAALEEKLLLAHYAHARLGELPGWVVGPEPDLSVVTFRYAPQRGDGNEFNRRLLEAVLADGSVAVSATELDGSYTLRLAILHYRSHLAEVDRFLDVLAREAARLER
jgi:glutamate/tyrosine decarboxylase-like PLP-dependent enzyme